MVNIKAKIYHAIDVSNSFFYKRDGQIYNQFQAAAAFIEGGYELAGEVEVSVTDNWLEAIGNAGVLEVVYMKSQNIDSHWNEDKPCRSTSVGDICDIEGELYIVASFGFEKLS